MLGPSLAHLNSLDLLPELDATLAQLIANDLARADQNTQWSAVVPALLSLLDLEPNHALPFTSAWTLMYAAISRLDHLQDGDVDADARFTSSLSVPALYNLALSQYVFATSLLDQLSPAHIPPSRLFRLRSLWSEQMLRMASGQQRDLMLQQSPTRTADLETYQAIAQYKTGATFALAFAGVAALATDDEAIVDALAVAGEVYGLLLQCCDDLADADHQPGAAGTFGSALRISTMAQTPAANADAFWERVYSSNWSFLAEILAPLPEVLRTGVFDIFRHTFGQPVVPPCTSADED